VRINGDLAQAAARTSMGLSAPSYMNAIKARSREVLQDRIISSIFSSEIICDAVFVALSAVGGLMLSSFLILMVELYPSSTNQ